MEWIAPAPVSWRFFLIAITAIAKSSSPSLLVMLGVRGKSPR
jgi:hypothetical protein